MKIKSGFELHNVMNENIIVAYGKQNINFSKVITLNESAAYVWNNIIGKEFTAQTIADLLMQEYEVNETTALADGERLLVDWINVGLIE